MPLSMLPMPKTTHRPLSCSIGCTTCRVVADDQVDSAARRHDLGDCPLLCGHCRHALGAPVQRDDDDLRTAGARLLSFGDDPRRIDEVGPPRLPVRYRQPVVILGRRDVRNAHAVHVEGRRRRFGWGASHACVIEAGSIEHGERGVDAGGALVHRVVRRQRAAVEASGAEPGDDLRRDAVRGIDAVGLAPGRRHRGLQVADRHVDALDDGPDDLEHRGEVVTRTAGIVARLLDHRRVRQHIASGEQAEAAGQSGLGGHRREQSGRVQRLHELGLRSSVTAGRRRAQHSDRDQSPHPPTRHGSRRYESLASGWWMVGSHLAGKRLVAWATAQSRAAIGDELPARYPGEVRPVGELDVLGDGFRLPGTS